MQLVGAENVVENKVVVSVVKTRMVVVGDTLVELAADLVLEILIEGVLDASVAVSLD